jgi:hypothetical protein
MIEDPIVEPGSLPTEKMMRTSDFHRVLILGMAMLCARTAAADNDCDQVLKQGIFNSSTLSKSTLTQKSYQDWLCSTSYSRHDDALEQGVAMGVPFYGVPLKAGGRFSQAERDNFYRDQCRGSKASSDVSTNFMRLVSTVDPKVVSAWTRCYFQGLDANGRAIVLQASHSIAGLEGVDPEYLPSILTLAVSELPLGWGQECSAAIRKAAGVHPSLKWQAYRDAAAPCGLTCPKEIARLAAVSPAERIARVIAECDAKESDQVFSGELRASRSKFEAYHYALLRHLLGKLRMALVRDNSPAGNALWGRIDRLLPSVSKTMMEQERPDLQTEAPKK